MPAKTLPQAGITPSASTPLLTLMPTFAPKSAYRTLIDDAEKARALLDTAQERYNQAQYNVYLYEMSESGGLHIPATDIFAMDYLVGSPLPIKRA